MREDLSGGNQHEEWRPLPVLGYSISSLAQVRNDKTGRLLHPAQMKNTWARVVILSDGGRAFREYLHTLMAKAFLGECPDSHRLIFKNGTKGDCRSDNLAYAPRRVKKPKDTPSHRGHTQARIAKDSRAIAALIWAEICPAVEAQKGDRRVVRK